MEAFQPPNKPNYKRIRREKKELSDLESDFSSSESEEESTIGFFDSIRNQARKNTIEILRKSNVIKNIKNKYKKHNKVVKKKIEIEKKTNKPIEKKIQGKTDKPLEKKNQEKVDKLLGKNIQERTDKRLEKIKENEALRRLPSSESYASLFKLHIPKWGANIFYQGGNVFVSNTCNIDYYLFSLWGVNLILPNFLENIPRLSKTEKLIEVINNIDKLNWDKARELWIIEFINFREKPNRKTISLFGSERSNFIQHIEEFQRHDLIQRCSELCPDNNKILSNSNYMIFFEKNNQKVELISAYGAKCYKCNQQRITHFNFYYNPNFILIESARANTLYSELPLEIEISNKIFKLFSCTIFNSELSHFVGIFYLNQEYFLVDDLGQHIEYITQNTASLKRSNKKRNNSTYRYNFMKVTAAFYYSTDS